MGIQTTPPPLWYILRCLLRGLSLARAYLNWETRAHTISGMVLDVGSGKFKKYHELVLATNVNMEYVDQKEVDNSRTVDIDVEILPYSNGIFNAVVLFNILEHTFAYQHVVDETYRVLQDNGSVVGFVPFLVRYHPDPHDFFRYTNESLIRILGAAGYRNILVYPLGRSFIAVQFHLMSQYLPRWIAFCFYPIFHLGDIALVRMRPHMPTWYPLGYFFTAEK